MHPHRIARSHHVLSRYYNVATWKVVQNKGQAALFGSHSFNAMLGRWLHTNQGHKHLQPTEIQLPAEAQNCQKLREGKKLKITKHQLVAFSTCSVTLADFMTWLLTQNPNHAGWITDFLDHAWLLIPGCNYSHELIWKRDYSWSKRFLLTAHQVVVDSIQVSTTVTEEIDYLDGTFTRSFEYGIVLEALGKFSTVPGQEVEEDGVMTLDCIIEGVIAPSAIQEVSGDGSAMVAKPMNWRWGMKINQHLIYISRCRWDDLPWRWLSHGSEAHKLKTRV
jgi:hypothetical protein